MSFYNTFVSISFRLIFFLLIVINYTLFILYNWIQLCKSEIKAYFIIAIYTLLTILLLMALALTVYTNPGEVPFYWGFRHGDEDNKRKRYCLMCNVFKPDRCHHCSICNRCILNMDHHCPWINNCIGYYNRKYFLQMLFNIVLILLFSVFINFRFFYGSSKELLYYQNIIGLKSLLYNLTVIFMYVLDLAALVIIFLFSKFHVRLVLDNKTTIETVDKNINDFKSPYSLGEYNNFCQVFGYNKVLWFLPIKDISGVPIGNGIDWQGNFNLNDYDFSKEKELKNEDFKEDKESQSVSFNK